MWAKKDNYLYCRISVNRWLLAILAYIRTITKIWKILKINYNINNIISNLLLYYNFFKNYKFFKII